MDHPTRTRLLPFALIVVASCLLGPLSAFAAAPTLDQPADMTVNEGATADQILTATDPDGDPLTFVTVSGPTYSTVTTTNATTGNIHLAPGFLDQGTTSATVRATDGTLGSDKSFAITVNGVNRAPVLTQPANMFVEPAGTKDQVLTASDPDGDALTFSKVSGPTYMSVTTTNATTGNVHLAPGFSEEFGTFSASVSASDGTLTDGKSFVITLGQCNLSPTLFQPANMTVLEGRTADQVISGTNPCGHPMTFTKVAGPAFMTVLTISSATGNVHLAPVASDIGTYSVTVNVSDGSLNNQKSFTITVVLNTGNHQPILAQPSNMTVIEGATADQVLNATDSDGNALAFSKVSGPLFVFVTTTTTGVGTATGTIHLSPGFSEAGNYSVSVRVSDGSLTDTKFLLVTVDAANRCPVAIPGGPYSGNVGVPVAFDGTASTDPDGDVLTYAWDFDASDGVGTDATGPTVSHAYGVAGTFTVTLTVTDNAVPPCGNTATTTASILAACPATVFNGYDVIRLNSGKPSWFAFVQPSGGCYANTEVVLASIVLKYSGAQIPVDESRVVLDTDKNGDGIAEIRVNFSKANLRTLFAGLPNGRSTVEVTLQATLASGGLISGTSTVDVVNNGSFSAVEVSPNPFNPEATLTFTTSRPGPVRVELFDISGRRVRTLHEDPALAAGTHEVRLDGRGSRGEPLPSGIYFVRVISTEGTFERRVVLLK